MTSFFDEIARNNVKSLILMAIFTGFFALVIYVFVLFLGGGPGALMIGLVMVILYAMFTYFTGDKLVLAVSRAKEADRKQYPTFYAAAEGLSSAMQVKMPKLYVINDPNPNAFATGRKSKPSIAATTGLLSMMNRDELEGVISHEMSHIADNDVQMMTLMVAFAGSIGLIAAFVRNMAWFGFRGRDSRGGGGLILIAALLVGLLAPIFALLIRLAISRRREYLADANGARVTRDPSALAGALKKIQTYAASPGAQNVMHANEITASLYFANPFTAKSLLNLFSTHPPIEDRIKRLQAMY